MKEKEDMDEGQIYEIGFHILPSVPEEKIQEVVSKIEDSINQNEGTIISQEFPKVKILSYEIKKRIETKYSSFNKAYFGWIKFEIVPAAVAKIKEEATNNQNILRFIIIKTVRENTMHTPKPPMMRGEGSDDAKALKGQPVLPLEKVEVSEAEIDKSIDELLVNDPSGDGVKS